MAPEYCLDWDNWAGTFFKTNCFLDHPNTKSCTVGRVAGITIGEFRRNSSPSASAISQARKKTAEKTGASFRIRSYFILTFCIASFGRFAGWWGHDRKSRFEMGHGKYCFLLFLFVVILFLSEWRKQKVLVWNGLSFRGIMIGSTCSVFKCLTCDQPFFFTAVTGYWMLYVR